MTKDRPCAGENCSKLIYRDTKTGLCRSCLNKQQYHHASPTIDQVLQKRQEQSELTRLRKRYEESLKTVERLQKQLHINQVLDGSLDTFTIEPSHSSGKNEGIPVLIASDWHIEETVDAATVNGLNEFNLDIAQQRVTNFFQSGLELIHLLNQDIRIKDVVIPLLGDFITGRIHEELNDLTELLPIHAIVQAQRMIVSGIDFLVKSTDYHFMFPCHSGNHARTTKTTHFSSEDGHSLEYLLYMWLADHYHSEPRVQFMVPNSYHSYLNIYDKTLRLHHGHAIKYSGGIGGLYIPVNKAIAQWNKGQHVDLDVFGHYHQWRDGGNFVSNGSLIGYSGFAISIKADFEVPKQGLFLMDKKRGRTATWPVYL